MLKYLRWPIRFLAAILVLFILYINVNLYKVPVCDPAPGDYINVDARKQLHFLKRQLHEEQAAEEMQLLYPEGYVFIYALYALAWCEVVETLPLQGVGWQEGMREISFSLRAMESPRGRAVFNHELPLTYGAFYRGWTSYVRGRYLQLCPTTGLDTLEMQRFQGECAAIAQAISLTEKPYLETYDYLAWPADNIVCLAALSLHDHIVEPRFQAVKNDWLIRIKSTLIPEYGLIPHAYDLDGDRPLDGVRGSSQSLMLIFLLDIDSVFAQEQYQNYRRHFLAYRLGLPGIREYPHGEVGFGDIDSGPVVMGIGGAASIVGINTAIMYEDWQLALNMRAFLGRALWKIK